MNKSKVLVILDRAHGNNCKGKGSPWTLKKVKPELPFKEWEYSEEIIQRLQPILESEGYKVWRDVTEEEDIKLLDRGKRINLMCTEARKKGLHPISISIHNNAAGKGNKWIEAYGWSVWTTPGQNNSDKLAECLYQAAESILIPLGQKTRRDKSDGDNDYEANFAMCRIPTCPAVLTENMFQDCIKEVEFLLTEEGKNAIVEIHRKGIEDFCKMMGWFGKNETPATDFVEAVNSINPK